VFGMGVAPLSYCRLYDTKTIIRAIQAAVNHMSEK
jgi:hypothetical protein